MSSLAESCLHLEGFRVSGGSEFVCSGCAARLGSEAVARWVRDAEKARDEAYSLIGGDEFGEIVREERQQEVYRRRKVMYELRSAPRIETARPEMILVTHEPDDSGDGSGGSYECRIFYKEPRPDHVVDRLSVAADIRAILELRSDPSPVARVAAQKVEEFHLDRVRLSDEGEAAPGRRVFYASDL